MGQTDECANPPVKSSSPDVASTVRLRVHSLWHVLGAAAAFQYLNGPIKSLSDRRKRRIWCHRLAKRPSLHSEFASEAGFVVTLPAILQDRRGTTTLIVALVVVGLAVSHDLPVLILVDAAIVEVGLCDLVGVGYRVF